MDGKVYQRRVGGPEVVLLKLDETHVTLRQPSAQVSDLVLPRRTFEEDFVVVAGAEPIEPLDVAPVMNKGTLDYIRDIIQAGIDNASDFGDFELRGPDWINGYRAALTGLLMNLPKDPTIEEAAALEIKLADCLADAIDTPIMKVRDTLGGPEIELRLGAWLPELSERAAELLEEAGR